MTDYDRAAYGSTNPNDGRPANGDNAAWGGHQYPAGVPDNLIGTTTGQALNGQAIAVKVRAELVPLWNLLWQIARKHGYQVWANNNGEAWGPWGYENRAISGTNNPSGHSMALSVDINAPYNPYSYTFQSDMPPAMVADFEACGLYWGGRYEGQKYDAMHFGYCYPPASVAGHIKTAQSILAALGGGAAEEDDDVDDATIAKIAKETAEATVDAFERRMIRSNFVAKDKDGRNTVEDPEDRNIFETVGSSNTNTTRIFLGKDLD